MLLLIVYERVHTLYYTPIYRRYTTHTALVHLPITHTQHIHTPTPTHAHVSVDETELVWIEIVPSSCVTITTAEPPPPSVTDYRRHIHLPTSRKHRNGEITSRRTAVVVQPQHETIFRRRRTHVYQYHYTSDHNAFLPNNRSRIYFSSSSSLDLHGLTITIASRTAMRCW